MNLIFLAAVIILLLALNGLFVAAEFAAVSIKRPRLAQLVASGDGGARRLAAVVENPHRLDIFISTCQLGITVTSLALGSYGQARVIEWLEPLLARLAPQWVELSSAIATALVLIVLTILQVILAELAPKNIAIRYPEQVGLLTLRPLQIIQTVLRPLIALFNGSGRVILRLLGSATVAEHSHIHSPEEIVLLVQASEAGGKLDEDERDLLVNTLELRRLTARKVMIPRTRILAADIDEPVDQLFKLLASSRFSRMPLYEGTIDRVVGLVHIKDLLLAQRQPRPQKNDQPPLPITARSLLHPIQEVPDSLTIEKTMEIMQHKRCHLAIVVDEYGGTAGMITFEDLIEEIIGEFRDEFDKSEVPPWELRNRDELWLRGDLQLDEINALLGAHFSTVAAETIGGTIVSELGHVPAAGERIEIAGRMVRVERLAGNAILLVSTQLNHDEVARVQGLPPMEKTDKVTGKTDKVTRRQGDKLKEHESPAALIPSPPHPVTLSSPQKAPQ